MDDRVPVDGGGGGGAVWLADLQVSDVDLCREIAYYANGRVLNLILSPKYKQQVQPLIHRRTIVSHLAFRDIDPANLCFGRTSAIVAGQVK